MSNNENAQTAVENQVQILESATKVAENKTSTVLAELAALGRQVEHLQDTAEALARSQYKAILAELQRDINHRAWFSACIGFTNDDVNRPIFQFNWKKTLTTVGKIVAGGAGAGAVAYLTVKGAERGARRGAETSVGNLLAAGSAEDDTSSDDLD